MKRYLGQFLMLFVVGLALVSCKDDPGESEIPSRTPTIPLVFDAVVNGTEWSATSATATYNYNCDILEITASAADGTSITLLFEDLEAPVTLPISMSTVSQLVYIDEFGSAFSNANSPAGDNPVGQVTLSAFDAVGEKASGAFGGTVYFGGSLSVSVTNGSFQDVRFTTDMESEDCDPQGPEYPETLVSWKLNDFDRSSNNIVEDSSNDTLIALEFATGAGDKIAFAFDHEIEMGIYQIIDEAEATASFEIESVQQYNTGGTITILEHNLEAKHLHGVFEATVVAAVSGDNNTISEGEFFINY